MRRDASYPPARYHDPVDRRLTQIIKASRDAKSKAVNLLGIPYDGAVLGRKGAAKGPAEIRRALSFFSNYDVESGLDLLGLRAFDVGDLVPRRGGVAQVQAEVERAVGRELEPDSLLILIGGDNSISLPALRAYAGRFGRIGLVVIDSHLDLRGKIGGNPTSGSSYGLAIGTIPTLDPARVVEMGMHGFLNSKRYAEKANRLGVTVIGAAVVREEGPEAAAKRAFETASDGADAVYLSVDMDSVDLAQVSGVSAPSVGGLSASEVGAMVRVVARRKEVKCADVVETAPDLDPSGRSQIVAATCVVSMMAGFAERRKRL